MKKSGHTVLLSSLVTAVATATLTTVVVSQGIGESTEAWQMYAVPGPEHDILDQLAGQWTFELSEPGKSSGGEPSTLSVDYRWALGGRFLVGKYEGWIDGEHFTAREILGYDRFRKTFESFWVDNTSTGFTVSEGSFNKRSRELTFEGTQDDPIEGERDKRFEMTYAFKSDKEFGIEVRHERDGKMVTAVDVVAHRPD